MENSNSLRATSTVTSGRLAGLGRAATVSGLLGVAVGVVTLAYPAAVPSDQWSYPFPTGVQWGSSIVVLALGARLDRGRFRRGRPS